MKQSPRETNLGNILGHVDSKFSVGFRVGKDSPLIKDSTAIPSEEEHLRGP